MFRSLHRILFLNMALQAVLLTLFLFVILAMLSPLRSYMVEPYHNPCERVRFFDCGGVASTQDLRPLAWWAIVLPGSAIGVYESLRTERPPEAGTVGLVVGYVEIISLMLAFVYLLLLIVSGIGNLIRNASRAKSPN